MCVCAYLVSLNTIILLLIISYDLLLMHTSTSKLVVIRGCNYAVFNTLKLATYTNIVLKIWLELSNYNQQTTLESLAYGWLIHYFYDTCNFWCRNDALIFKSSILKDFLLCMEIIHLEILRIFIIYELRFIDAASYYRCRTKSQIL